MGDWLFGWVYDLFYILQKSICYILDFIREIFCKLAGIEAVTVNGNQEDLLSHFLLSDGVRNAFLGVFLVGVILLFVFVIIAIIKSEVADPQHKKTKGQILVKALQSFVIFLLIPFLLLAGIMLTNAIMGAINGSMEGGMIDGSSNTYIGGQILVTSGHGAYKGDPGMRESIERMFITGQLDYNNIDVVKKYYALGDMNFFVGITGGLVILIMFVMSAVMFVQRLFDIILLYVVSPASVSTIPLDEGGRFRIWREMLVSKVLSAYGIILSMNLFFLIIPRVSQISFFGDGFKDGVVQLLFVLGGAFAITKANMVIAQLTGSNAGAQEAQQMLSNIHSGIHMARTAGHVAAGAAGMVIGGTDFLRNRKHGATFSENVSATIHSQRNRKEVSTDDDNGFDTPGGDGSGGANTNGTTVSETAAGQNKGMDSNNLNDTEANSSNANTAHARQNHSVSDTATTANAANGNVVSDAVNTAHSDQDNTGMVDNIHEPQGFPTENNSDVSDAVQAQKQGAAFGSVVKGATRLATLPAGVMKDLIQGGVIVAGKNFIPRVKNVLKGNSIVSHADVPRILKKEDKK